MPGLETIGTSIGITCHLQSYLQKLSPFSYTDEQDCFRVDSCLVEINTHLTLIHNAILTTLANAIDEDELAELLNDVNGKDWKSPLIENKAQKGLGVCYKSFCIENSRLRVCLNGLSEILGLPVPGQTEGKGAPLQVPGDFDWSQRQDLSTYKLEKINGALEEIGDGLRRVEESFHSGSEVDFGRTRKWVQPLDPLPDPR